MFLFLLTASSSCPWESRGLKCAQPILPFTRTYDILTQEILLIPVLVSLYKCCTLFSCLCQHLPKVQRLFCLPLIFDCLYLCSLFLIFWTVECFKKNSSHGTQRVGSLICFLAFEHPTFKVVVKRSLGRFPSKIGLKFCENSLALNLPPSVISSSPSASPHSSHQEPLY